MTRSCIDGTTMLLMWNFSYKIHSSNLWPIVTKNSVFLADKEYCSDAVCTAQQG